MNKLRRFVGILASAMVLVSCSSTKLAYNNLDWLAEWRMGDYVDLYGPAETVFEERFNAVWKWHRTTQLPLYVSDIRELAGVLDNPISYEQAEAWLKRIEAHADTIVERALPDWGDVMAALDDEQTHNFLEKLDEKRKEQIEEIAEGDHWDSREKRVENMHDGLERWLGRMTPEQEKRVETWADELRFDPPLRLRIRTESNAAFATLMQTRKDPGFQERLKKLVDDPQLPSSAERDALLKQNRRAGLSVMADLSTMLTADQRKRLRSELAELADDLEDLSRQK